MDLDEIRKYCGFSGSVCVYRKRVKKAQFIVQSMNIFLARGVGYELNAEFDPMTLVDQGEGVRWSSDASPLEAIVEAMEQFSGRPIDEWENITKTAYVPHYDGEGVTVAHYQASWDRLAEKYDNGKALLPDGLRWHCHSLIGPLHTC